MKKYISPELELVSVGACDVISTSVGTETTPVPEGDGVWDLDLT